MSLHVDFTQPPWQLWSSSQQRKTPPFTEVTSLLREASSIDCVVHLSVWRTSKKLPYTERWVPFLTATVPHADNALRNNELQDPLEPHYKETSSPRKRR